MPASMTSRCVVLSWADSLIRLFVYCCCVNINKCRLLGFIICLYDRVGQCFVLATVYYKHYLTHIKIQGYKVSSSQTPRGKVEIVKVKAELPTSRVNCG